MDEGRIVEMGIYDELMEKEGKLAEIIKSQNSSSDGKSHIHSNIENRNWEIKWSFQ